MGEIKYVHILPNTQYFYDIDQIIEFVKTADLSDELNKEYLLMALLNTKKKSELFIIDNYENNNHICHNKCQSNCKCNNIEK